MKVLVTGGAGYVGSVLVPTLLAKGYAVSVIDNFLYGQTSLLDHCLNKNLTIINGDARDENLLQDVLKGVDAIFPLACLTGAPACARFPVEAESIILHAVRSLLRHRSKNQLIIYPATNSGYGIGVKSQYCTEETLLRPVSIYGKLKVAAEEEIMQSGNAITLRLATAFGLSPRMRLDLLVNDFVYRAVNDRFVVLFEANFKRNFIHVRDVAEAFIHSLTNFDKMKNEAYNVGLSNTNIDKRELCWEIKKQLPNFCFFEEKVGNDPDERNYIVSNRKIEKTGFRPTISLQTGIYELVKGYQIIKKNQYANS